MTRLTDTKVRKLTKPGLYSADTTLYIRVSKTGGKSWIQRTIFNGERHDIGLGGWPVVTVEEESELPVKRTLAELGVSRSSFYRWYQYYLDDGPEGLEPGSRSPRRFWNRLPETAKEQCLDVALQYPDKSPRELAWTITDEHSYFISESSVYRLLKQYDLITSPAYILMQAGDSFQNPTRRVNELWQTDFTYFRVVGWGWYYLSTVLDDYSRYIIAWKLTTSRAADDVKQTAYSGEDEHRFRRNVNT